MLKALERTNLHHEAKRSKFAFQDPTLCYLLHNDLGHLAYRALVTYFDSEDNITKREYAYISAVTGILLLENSLFWNAKNREVYTAAQGTRLPGTLKR